MSTPDAAESGDLLLILFRERYDGFQFHRGLSLEALGKSGPDREFNALHRRGALVGSSLNLTKSILLEIPGKVFENTLDGSHI
jgi:hypothetical protein